MPCKSPDCRPRMVAAGDVIRFSTCSLSRVLLFGAFLAAFLTTFFLAAFFLGTVFLADSFFLACFFLADFFGFAAFFLFFFLAAIGEVYHLRPPCEIHSKVSV